MSVFSDNEEKKVVSGGAKAIVIWGLSILVVIGLANTAYFMILPHWRDAETKGLEHSYTFVQTKKELLIKLSQDTRNLDTQIVLHVNDENRSVGDALEAQRKATLIRLQTEAALLSPSEVPEIVRPYLREHVQ